MTFHLLILDSDLNAGEPGSSVTSDIVSRIRNEVPEVQVTVCGSPGEALEAIGEADAAYGDITADLFERAGRLRWIQCPAAGPPAGWYHDALIDSDVVVTNMRGVYSDVIGTHIMSYVLAFARGLPTYLRQQADGRWAPGAPTVHLPDSTTLIVGVGGIGAEAARLCAAFGMTVEAIDARATESPPGVTDLHRPGALHSVLPRADFVMVTVPETPQTQGLFGASEFGLMKETAHFINIGRGATVNLADLDTALRSGDIAGAALDVFEIEPLPEGHPLWTAPGMVITPHVAATGPETYIRERRTDLFVDNCVRFREGRPLRNVVDKANWF